MKRYFCLLIFALTLSLPSFANNQEYAVITPENIGEIQQVSRFGRGAVRDLVWSPDGRKLVVLAADSLWIYDTADFSGEAIEITLPPDLYPEGYSRLRYSSDSSILHVFAYRGDSVLHYETDNWNIVHEDESQSETEIIQQWLGAEVPQNTYFRAFPLGENWIIVETYREQVSNENQGWDKFYLVDGISLETLKEIELPYNPSWYIVDLVISQDLQHLIVGYTNGIRIYSLPDFVLLAESTVPTDDAPTRLKVSANSSLIGLSTDRLHLWRLADLLSGITQPFEEMDFATSTFDFSPDGASIIYNNAWRSSYVIHESLTTNEQDVIANDFYGYSLVSDSSYNPESGDVYALIYDREPHAWFLQDLTTGERAIAFAMPPNYGLGSVSLFMSPSGRYLIATRAIGGTDQRDALISLWEYNGSGFYNQVREILDNNLGNVVFGSFSLDETRFAGHDYYYSGANFREWQLPNLEVLDEYDGIYPHPIHKYSQEGELLEFVAERDGDEVNISVRPVYSSQKRLLSTVWFPGFAPFVVLQRSYFWDSQQIIIIPNQTIVQGINWNTGEEVFRLDTDLDDISVDSINPSGELIVLRNSEGLSFWNLATHEVVLSNFGSPYMMPFWSADGKMLITQEGGIIRWWAIPE
jgi:hypothetical protein